MNTDTAVTAFLAAKYDKSPRTIEQYSSALGHLATACSELPITPRPIRSALSAAPTPWVRAAWFRCWRCFFRWAAREWGIVNPMKLVDAPDAPDRACRTHNRRRSPHLQSNHGRSQDVVLPYA